MMSACLLACLFLAEAKWCGAQDAPAAAEGITIAQPQPLSATAVSNAVADAGAPVYKESFCYPANVRRVYKPAFTPQISSLFMNPRTFPAAVGVIADPSIQYAGMYGWHFGSPSGFTSGAPRESHALAYQRGELDITKNLYRGLPEGMKVVEPLLVPVQPVCRRGGIYIDGGPSQILLATPCPAPDPANSRRNGHGEGNNNQPIAK